MDQDTNNLSFDEPNPVQSSTHVTSSLPKKVLSKKDILAKGGLVIFGLVLFLFFLILKLPEARLQNYLQAHLRIESQKMGYIFNAEKISLGIFFGPSLKLTKVELKSIDNQAQIVKIDYIKVRPHLFSLLPFSKVKKISIDAKAFDGEIDGTIGMGPEAYVIDVSTSQVSLPRIASLLSPIPLSISSGTLNADVDLNILTNTPEQTTGRIDAELKSLSTPTQSIFGFNLPSLTITESQLEVTVSAGKALIRKFDIGKEIKKDDIVAKITGEAVIDGQKNIYNPLSRLKLNLKTTFELSNKVTSSFTFLDAILGPAKDASGKYNYSISGTAAAPIPSPGK